MTSVMTSVTIFLDKILKEQLHKLLHCGYFDLVATPPATSLKEMEAPMVKKASARISSKCSVV